MATTSMPKAPETNAEKVGGCLLILALIPFADALQAIAISTTWRWFVLPTFPAAPRITAPIAAGLVIVLQLVWISRAPAPSQDKRRMLEAFSDLFARGVALPAILFLAAWIIKAVWL